MRINHVLIDYENVQPEIEGPIDPEVFRITFLLGALQKHVPTELLLKLQAKGIQAQWIQCPTVRKNALDFLLAFQLGEIVGTSRDVCLHVISKDGDFDPLLEYVHKTRKIPAYRHPNIAGIPALRKMPDSLKERVAEVIAYFKTPTATKPRTQTTFRNLVAKIFRDTLQPNQLDALIAELTQRGHIKENGTKLEHAWPVAPSAEARPKQKGETPTIGVISAS